MHIDSFKLVIGQQWLSFKTQISHLTEMTRGGQGIVSKWLYKGLGESGKEGVCVFWGRGFLQMNYFLFPKHLVQELSKHFGCIKFVADAKAILEELLVW